MTTKKLFVSRNLHEKSPFWELRDRLEIYDTSLLLFHSIPFPQMPISNWLFFYSQQGVAHFFKQATRKHWIDKKMAAFGPKTAAVLEEHAPNIHFVGDGKADSTAAALELVTNEQTVLFIRAKRSRRSVQTFLSKKAHPDLVVYDNQAKPAFDLPICDFLIFTSPLNAKTYFDKYKKAEGQVIFAIGHTTASTLEQLTAGKIWVPPDPSEEALMTLLQKHL